MLISFNYLYEKYKLNITGIIHIGAHECEEIIEYEKYINRDKILWVEALPDKVIYCKNKYPNLKIEEAVVSNVNEEVTFNIANNTQASSYLELGTCTIIHPEICFINSFKTNTKTMNEILENYNNISFNFLNMDIQGTELKALKGMEKYLNTIDYIYTEINNEYVYKNCTLINELDEYLKNFNFKRVEIHTYGIHWGDAFYIKIK